MSDNTLIIIVAALWALVFVMLIFCISQSFIAVEKQKIKLAETLIAKIEKLQASAPDCEKNE